MWLSNPHTCELCVCASLNRHAAFLSDNHVVIGSGEEYENIRFRAVSPPAAFPKPGKLGDDYNSIDTEHRRKRLARWAACLFFLCPAVWRQRVARLISERERNDD